MNKLKITLGKQLREYRKKAGLTQPELAKTSGVATSIVNDIENGIRVAGSKTLDRIAKGLQLSDEQRYQFLLIGLIFSKRDFMIPDFQAFPPEILNFLPYALSRVGIKPIDIIKVKLPSSARESLEILMKNNKAFRLDIRIAPCSGTSKKSKN